MDKHLVYIAGSAIDDFYEIETFVGEGDSTLAKPLGSKIGGCVLNAASVSAKLGSDVMVLDYLKSDDEGTQLLLQGMRNNDIDTSYICQDRDVVNGKCLVMRRKDEKCIYVIQPKRPFFEKDDRLKDLLNNASYIYSLMHTVKISFRDEEILREARRHGARIVFDGSSQYRMDYEKEMMLELADAFFMNKEAYQRLKEVSGREPVDILLEKGAEFACVTDGARGATCYTKDGIYTKSAFKVDVVDSTGAGDSFAGSFLHFRNKGYAFRDCLEYASACGAYACTKEGGMAGAVKEEELLNFYNSL